MNKTSDINEMIFAIKQFYSKNGFEIGTNSRETILYRTNLMMEELGEICQCLTKGKGNIAEEHIDLFILILGNCITLNIDIVEEFWKKYEIIMDRDSIEINGRRRVTNNENSNL